MIRVDLRYHSPVRVRPLPERYPSTRLPLSSSLPLPDHQTCSIPQCNSHLTRTYESRYSDPAPLTQASGPHAHGTQRIALQSNESLTVQLSIDRSFVSGCRRRRTFSYFYGITRSSYLWHSNLKEGNPKVTKVMLTCLDAEGK